MKNYTLKDIDEQIEKWTFRKVWMQKCELEAEVESLKNEVSVLREENSKFLMQTTKSYNPNISLLQLERDYILAALKFHKNDKFKAATDLGITTKTLYNKLHDYGYFAGKSNDTNFDIYEYNRKAISDTKNKGVY